MTKKQQLKRLEAQCEKRLLEALNRNGISTATFSAMDQEFIKIVVGEIVRRKISEDEAAEFYVQTILGIGLI